MNISVNQHEEHAIIHYPVPFRNNAQFLEAKLQEYLLFIERSLLMGKMRKLTHAEGKGKGNESAPYKKAYALFLKKSEEYENIREKNLTMLKYSGDEPFPFVELAKTYNLDNTDQHILWLLFFNSMASEFTELCKNSVMQNYFTESKRRLSIGDIVRTICPESFEEQLLMCRHFGINSPIVKAHLVVLTTYFADSFLDIEVSIPARVVKHIAADENEYEADNSFSIERPDVPMSFVVLPEEQKKKVLMFVENYEKSKLKQEELKFDKILSYGRGLIILFYGPPGTGKTLFAKAIATYTNKPLISIRTQKKETLSGGIWRGVQIDKDDISELFREAKMRNGIVFIDECEQICAKSKNEVYTVLREIEHTDTIVIMTTNVPYELAEPLDRRITLKVRCDIPSPALRKEIWEKHLPDTVPLSNDVNLDVLAKKYLLSGGYIKNGVVTAMNVALSRNGGGEFILTHEDLDTGAKLQERHLGNINLFVERVQPLKKIESLVLADAMKEKLRGIINIARNYRTLTNPAQFINTSVNGGLKVLFFGISPSVAMDAAEAIACELNTPISRVALDKLLNKNDVPESVNYMVANSIIAETFASAHATGELLVFHDRTSDYGNSQESRAADNTEFLAQFRKYDGIVIVVSNARSINEKLLRTFHYMLYFDVISCQERFTCWKEATVGLPIACDVDFNKIAEKYTVNMEEIRDAVHVASLMRGNVSPPSEIDMRILENAIKQVSSKGTTQAKLFGG